jgi:hypothetical protein
MANLPCRTYCVVILPIFIGNTSIITLPFNTICLNAMQTTVQVYTNTLSARFYLQACSLMAVDLGSRKDKPVSQTEKALNGASLVFMDCSGNHV